MLISSGIIEILIKSQPINLHIPALKISVKKRRKRTEQFGTCTFQLSLLNLFTKAWN